MDWDFQREESFEPLPEGDYRIRIESAEMAVSKNGNQMLSLKFVVSGDKRKLFHHIVFLKDRPEITNRNLTNFFDSFAGIDPKDKKLEHWAGKIGACRVKHDDQDYAKVNYFIRAERQEQLPPWKEPDNATQSKKSDAEQFMNIPEGIAQEDLPF